MKTRLTALFAAATIIAAAAERSTASFEMNAWRNTMPIGTKGNTVFSPVGFIITASVMGEGIGGSARTSLMEEFGLMTDFAHIGAIHLASHKAANESNRVDVAVATSLWTTRRRALGANYIQTIQRGFEAEAGYLRDTLPVNAWIETATGGRIANALPEIPKRLDTMVINAVAFEGAWKKPFDDSLTKRAGFTRTDGGKTSMPMMRGELEMLLIARPRFNMYKLDFAAPNMHFIVVLPNKDVTLDSLREKEFSGERIDTLKILLKERTGSGVKSGLAEFTMPTFEVKSEWRLDAALRKVKLPRGGFNRIGNDTFVIDDVRQIVHFKVSETGYSLTPGFMPDEPGKEQLGGRRGELSATTDEEEDAPKASAGPPVVCDRPFLFFVWDSKTDSFLIAGQFTGDEAASKQKTDNPPNQQRSKEK